jgi:hypothetical protein
MNNDIICTNNDFIVKTEKEKDYLDDLKFILGKMKKKFSFEYNGVKFVSDREIIGIEPETYKLIYKNNN